MKLHQLHYFVAIASHGSIRAAARVLGVSQVAVTQGVRELERDARVDLFELRERFAPNGVGVIHRRHESLALPARHFLACFARQVRLAALSSAPEMRRIFHSIDVSEVGLRQCEAE